MINQNKERYIYVTFWKIKMYSYIHICVPWLIKSQIKARSDHEKQIFYGLLWVCIPLGNGEDLFQWRILPLSWCSTIWLDRGGHCWNTIYIYPLNHSVYNLIKLFCYVNIGISVAVVLENWFLKDINPVYFSFWYLSFENVGICFQIDLLLLEENWKKNYENGWMPDTRWSEHAHRTQALVTV